jgi:hypothetical protein
VDIDGIDVIAAISKTWVETIMQARRRHGQFDVRWEDGSWSKHLCHPEFMKGPIDMQGTCIDLEAAYRQCPVAKDERKYTVFAVKDPQSLKVIYFIANALPFGHRGSVPGFNRAAKALNHILHEDAGSSPSNYVDDFTLVGPKAIVQPQYARMLKLLTILGWKVKRKNLKRPEHEFLALGVIFEFLEENLSNHMNTSKLLIKNKIERIQKISKEIDRIEAQGIMSGLEAAELRGKMSYSTAQCFARIGALTFNLLNKNSDLHRSRFTPPELITALKWWCHTIYIMPPRTLDFLPGAKPIRILTDGSCEEKADQVGYGGIILDDETNEAWGFGSYMGDELKHVLTEWGIKTQVIGQAELYPMIVARKLLKEKLRHRDIIHFVDNDSARYASIKGYSPTKTSAWLVHLFWETEALCQCRSWIARVPSVSNLADAPSRGSKKEVEALIPHIKWLEWEHDRESEDVAQWCSL